MPVDVVAGCPIFAVVGAESNVPAGDTNMNFTR
jgi:hypothetical protein